MELEKKRSSALCNPIRDEMDAGNTKNKRCNICQRDYSSRNNYLKHMNIFHKDGNREQSSGRVKNQNLIQISCQSGPIQIIIVARVRSRSKKGRIIVCTFEKSTKVFAKKQLNSQYQSHPH